MVEFSTRDSTVHSVLERVAPVLGADNEHDIWAEAASFARDHFGADLGASVEFFPNDRAIFRSSEGFPNITDGLEFAVAPDSQAAFIRASNDVCVAGDINSDERFQAPGLLTSVGVHSTMGVAFDLASGNRGLLGVYTYQPDQFGQSDHETLGALASLVATAIDRLRLQRRLEVGASVDVVTGLDTRAAILNDLGRRLDANERVTALLVDLDGFKSVNDQHGHRAGDEVLRAIATRIARSVGVGDRVGRLGGDEFLLLFRGHTGTIRAEHLIGHIEEVIMVDARSISVSASIGISSSRQDDDVTMMLERADRKMYEAKALGRGHVRAEAPVERRNVHDRPGSTELPGADLAIVDHAIANLAIVVQPIVEATTGALHGVEALTRGPAGSSLEYPDRLFNAATTFGRLGELELASKRLAFDLDLDRNVTLFINLEPSLLCDTQWLAQLADAWDASNASRPVVAEVTERSVMDHPGLLLTAVDACRKLGWRIALDDVGARSESLAALRWIEPDIIKLDISLIRNENPAHSAHVVAAVAAYRDHLSRQGVIVIAEGVETAQDAALAEALGADLLQGFRYGRPCPFEQLTVNNECSSALDATRPIPYLGYRIGSKADLLNISRHIEASAVSGDGVVLSTLQDMSHFTRRTRLQYRAMARRCGFVGVLGVGVESAPQSEVTGVRLANLSPDDSLANTWQVLAMSPTTSLGLLATELPHESAQAPVDSGRLFSYRLVSSPDDVETAARALLHHF